MGFDFKDPTNNEWVTGFQAMDGGINANMASMQNGEFSIISLSILDKWGYDKNPPDVEGPSDEFDVECDTITLEKISVNNKDVMKMEAQCEGDDISMKARLYHYATNEKIMSYAYMTSPSSNFDNDVDKFENSVKTLKIQNQIDLTYEIPDSIGSLDTTSSEVTSTSVPGWIKTNAEWWAAGSIDDGEFVQGIQFLIKEGIMTIPETVQNNSGEESQTISPWIKSNVEWWAQGLTTDDDFVKGIQYLVEQGIIQV